MLSQFVFFGVARAAEAEKVLLLAEDVGRWISGAAILNASGRGWPDDALAPEHTGYDLASGVAGKVVYFAALYKATGKDEYLLEAKQGADFLISVIDDPAQFDGDHRRASLYTGLAGVGVAFLHVREVEPKYAAALRRVLDILDDWSVSDKDGTHWSERFNDLIYGDAGTVLFLTQLSKLAGYSRAGELAQQGGHFLLTQAIREGDKSRWLFRRDKEFNLPNFSHGTAGVAYVLATAGSQLDDADLRYGARAGFNYVRSIARTADSRLHIPYGWGSDQWQGLYEFGWAHGLTGSSLMFLRMQQANINADQATNLLALSRRTLASINLPGAVAEPFAEPSTPLDYRFGRAAYTGVFHGAAGIGLALLNMHTSMTGRSPYAEMPDSPF